ncbi:hypothetical protein B0H19DRAFT_1082342 [Mycena capillaripes]|nr:hypothetical protein B0H19DRAFT_1082342 [Mycena capillaripes]
MLGEHGSSNWGGDAAFPDSCIDPDIQQYAQCLDCLVVTGIGASEASLPDFQLNIDDFVEDCSKSGRSVHNVTVDGAYKSGQDSIYARGIKQLLAVAGLTIIMLGSLV